MSLEALQSVVGRNVTLQYGEGTDTREMFAEEVKHAQNGGTYLLCSAERDGKTIYRQFKQENITVLR